MQLNYLFNMEKSKIREVLSSYEHQEGNSASTSSKTQPNLDFFELINELIEFKKEGDSLLKQSKIEEAKNKYLQGYDLFEKDTEKSIYLFNNNPKNIQILSLYKGILSKIAECFYLQNNYENSIVYDLKILCLEPKEEQSIVRLFYSYLKKEKYQQATFYGDLFMDLDKDTEKSKNVKKDIENIKWIKSQNKINKIVINFSMIMTLLFAIVFFFKGMKAL